MRKKPTLKELQKIMERNGGWLDLSDTQITALPDNLTVGGWLDLRGTQITGSRECKHLTNGDYVPGKYIYCDEILTHVKRAKQIDGYTYYIGKIKGRNVISDGALYAHCNSFKDGVLDLEFKKAADRGADQYNHLTLDSVVSKDDAITMYRIITGACKAGTEQFLSTIREFKDEYTVREIIDITKGQYGANRLQKFFEELGNENPQNQT